jgi:hypothetical protein
MCMLFIYLLSSHFVGGHEMEVHEHNGQVCSSKSTISFHYLYVNLVSYNVQMKS